MKFLNCDFSDLELFKAVEHEFKKRSMKIERTESIHSVIENARQDDLGILVFNVKTVPISKEPVKKYNLAFNIMDLLDDYRTFLREKEIVIQRMSGCRKKRIDNILSAFDETEKNKHLKLVKIF